MKKILTILGLFGLIFVQAQVGINTDAPNATLDVVAKPTDATSPDGIIPPRISGNELAAKTAYGTAQKGAMVYVTSAATGTNLAGKTIDVKAPGQYMFNGTKWMPYAVGNISELSSSLKDSMNYRILPNHNHVSADAGFDGKGQSIGTGAANVALGYRTGAAMTTGGANTFLGMEAGRELTTGTHNTFIGLRASEYSKTGIYNTAIGHAALWKNVDGNSNTGVGLYALVNQATGSLNIGVGMSSGKNLLSGNRNIVIGDNTIMPKSNGSNQLNIGNSIYGTGINTGNMNTTRMGIATRVPNATLQVTGTAIVSNDTLTTINSLGYPAQFLVDSSTPDYVASWLRNTGKNHRSTMILQNINDNASDTVSYLTFMRNRGFPILRFNYVNSNSDLIFDKPYNNRIIFNDPEEPNLLVLDGRPGNNNVGIGVDTPNAKLHIKSNGSTKLTKTLEIRNGSNHNGLTVFDNSDVTIGGGLSGHNFSRLTVYDDDVQNKPNEFVQGAFFQINQYDNPTTFNNSRTISLAAKDDKAYVMAGYHHDKTNLALGTYRSREAILIEDLSGNVAIGGGTATPTTKLDVNGDIKVQGTGATITDGATCTNPGTISYGADNSFYGCAGASGASFWKKLHN